MGTLNIFDVLFTNKKSKTYQEALDSLARVESLVTEITMEYPDVSSKDIETIKNHWVELVAPVGKGVHTMGLHQGDDYNSLLVHYQEHSHLSPHFHSKEWELIFVLDGSCYDKETETKLSKGDIYVIPKGAVHHVISEEEECYMYIMFTSNKHNLKISDREKEIAKQLIGQKHPFKAE